MNKLFLFLLTILSITTASAQTSVNADGTIKHRGYHCGRSQFYI